MVYTTLHHVSLFLFSNMRRPPTTYFPTMLSIRNKLIYNDATLTSSSSITAFFTSYRFIPDMYLAIFELRLLNGNLETLKIPVNKFGMPLIARLINIDCVS